MGRDLSLGASAPSLEIDGNLSCSRSFATSAVPKRFVGLLEFACERGAVAKSGASHQLSQLSAPSSEAIEIANASARRLDILLGRVGDEVGESHRRQDAGGQARRAPFTHEGNDGDAHPDGTEQIVRAICDLVVRAAVVALDPIVFCRPRSKAVLFSVLFPENTWGRNVFVLFLSADLNPSWSLSCSRRRP
jgi:hypothetical protein